MFKCGKYIEIFYSLDVHSLDFARRTRCGTTYTNVQRTTPWTEWFDDGTTVTVSEPQDIINGYKFDHYDHPKESQ